jgi:hypothetical protein
MTRSKTGVTWFGFATTAGLVVLLVGCSATRTNFTSTWTPSNAQPVSAHGMQVAAVFINPNQQLRRTGEDVLANELTRFGAIGVASYNIMSADPKNRDLARRKLKEAGVDAVISMRVVNHAQVVSYSPGYWTGSPWHSSLWGYWGYGWGSVYQPGYLETETLVGVETLLYSLDQDKLLWAGVSESFNPKDLQSAVQKIAKKAVKKMYEENVLVK